MAKHVKVEVTFCTSIQRLCIAVNPLYQIIRTSWSVGKCSLQGRWARSIKNPNRLQHLRSSMGDLLILSILTMWQFPDFFWCFCQWWAISRLSKSLTYASTYISFVQAYGNDGRSLLTKTCLLSADAWLHPLFWGPCLLVWWFWFVIRLRIQSKWYGNFDARKVCHVGIWRTIEETN